MLASVLSHSEARGMVGNRSGCWGRDLRNFIVIFLMILGARIDILFIIKVVNLFYH